MLTAGSMYDCGSIPCATREHSKHEQNTLCWEVNDPLSITIINQVGCYPLIFPRLPVLGHTRLRPTGTCASQIAHPAGSEICQLRRLSRLVSTLYGWVSSTNLAKGVGSPSVELVGFYQPLLEGPSPRQVQNFAAFAVGIVLLRHCLGMLRCVSGCC